jgi:hypothetical protein
MTLSHEELLILKAELTNDPLNLGLTILPENDEPNAVILNEVRDSIKMYRASIPSDTLNIPIDEFNAASAGQQAWWVMQTSDGTINPEVIAPEFAKMFGANTSAKASFDAVAKEPASRVRQLIGRYYTVATSEVSQIRAAI